VHAILILSLDIRIVHASAGAAAMFGLESADELLGTSGFDLVDAQEIGQARQVVMENLASRPVDAMRPWRLRRRDGSVFLAEIEVTYLEEADREARILLSILDTSAQRRTTRALARALEWTDNLLDISGTMIVVLDAQGTVARINAEGCRLLGHPREWIIGKDWIEHFIPARLREEVRGVAQKLVAGDTEPVRHFENPVLTAAGEERIVFWHNSITRDDRGAVVEILSSGLDITDRVEAERRQQLALDQAEARQAELRALVRATTELHTARDFEAAAHAALSCCMEATAATGGHLLLWSAGRDIDPVLVVRSEARSAFVERTRAAAPGTFQDHVLASGEPVWENDFMASRWAATLPPNGPPIRNAIMVPLHVGERVSGLLGLANKPGGFGGDDARLLDGFARVLGLALAERRADEALRASELRHRTVFERAANPIARLSRDGLILDCNEQTERVFGWSTDELRGQPALMLVHADDHQRVAVDLGDILELKTYYQRHYKALHRDGHGIDIEVDAALAHNASGEPEIIIQVADVSERLRIERLQQLSNRLLRIFHEQRTLEGISSAFCDEIRASTGCAAVAVRARADDGSAPWLANRGFPEPLEHPWGALAEGETCGFATLVTVPIRFRETSLGLIHAAATEPRGIPKDVLTVLDESALQLGIAIKRIRTEEELQEHLAFQQELLEAIPIPVYYKDAEGRMIGWNRAWLRATGWRAAEVRGRRADEGLPEDLAELFTARDRELMERPGRQVFEHEFVSHGGQRRDTVLHRATFSRGGDEVGGIIGAMVDVTELKQATAAVEDLNRNLEAMVRERLAELQTLYLLSGELQHARSLRDLALAALHHLQGPVGADAYALAIRRGERCELFMRATRPVTDGVAAELTERLEAELRRLDIPDPSVGELEAHNTAAVDPEQPSLERVGTCYMVPLRIEGQGGSLGVLLAAAEADEALNENHARLLHLAAAQTAEAAQRIVERLPKHRASQQPAPTPDAPTGSTPPLHAVLDALPQPAFLLDPEHRVLHANSATGAHFGLDPTALRGRPLAHCEVGWEWSHIEPALLPGRLDAGPVQLTGLRITHAGGRMGVLDIWLSPLGTPAGSGGVVVLAEDVTLRRELDDRLHQARKMESIGQLASGIAHEINTPTQYVGDNLQFMGESCAELEDLLSTVRSLVEAGGLQGLPAPLQQRGTEAYERADLDYMLEELPAAAEQASEGVQRISSIVGAMREFSHGGSREKTVVDINRSVQSTVSVARNEWKYVATVELDLQPDLPSIPTLGAELNQVILNLLINAAHAIAAKGSSMGTIRIRTRREQGHLRIDVEDDGCGIPTDLQPRIFEPFFTTKPVGKGSGQGLAISRAIVKDKLHGQLGFVSSPGVGSTFTIHLPVSG